MAIPLIPWECHAFPQQIQAELRRRSINRGMRPVASAKASWTGDEDEWNNYRGPMTSWIRVCSNGYGFSENRMPGFVFYGGKNFSTSYGFNKDLDVDTRGGKGPNQTILGYTPEGVAHVLENDLIDEYPIHVPSPEIEKISAVIQKELLRRVRIEWTCFSFKQLEYMTPYFLVPGISVIVEWGWNHFNPLSLLDLKNTDRLAKYYNNPYPLYTENVLNSRGNYEVVFGIVTNFEWSIDGNKIKCVTEITSKDRLWAGQQVRSNTIESDSSLTEDANTVPTTGKPKSDTTSNTNVLDSLKKFVNQYIDKFKDIPDPKVNDADAVLTNFKKGAKFALFPILQYIKEQHPTNWKEYVFGIYYGRDELRDNIGANQEFDFDMKNPGKEVWLNMGLVIEIINFFSSQLKGVKDKPMFRVDVDDCVISGHPNLISTNGSVLLIPNALAPKYFSGQYGYAAEKDSPEYLAVMNVTDMESDLIKAPNLDPNQPAADRKYADYRLRKILLPIGKTRRDDHNSIINMVRFRYAGSQTPSEFPFSKAWTPPGDISGRVYSEYFTGLFRNLYINTTVLRNIINDESVVFYSDVVKRLFSAINGAAAGFWKLSLQSGTGKSVNDDFASMKVVDENLTLFTSNKGEVFTFDYYAADGLLQAINFRPTLSNAQAIRTIYAQTNLTNKKRVVQSGHDELLDYKFRDRLFMLGDESANRENPTTFKESSFRDSMGRIQTINPPDPKVYQVSWVNKRGEKSIYRLALPPGSEEILSLMLDDNDRGHNPRYTGIMPGIQAEFTIQGIAGIRTFAVFRVRGLPAPYSEKDILFRVINVNDTIQNGQWVTQIIAGVIPLRGYFADKLGLSPTKDVNKLS